MEMSLREEAPPAPVEDRKLSVVKSWFTRSVSFGGVHHSATAAAAAAASKGLSEEHGQNGEDQEAWGGFNTTLKQLSMRRSKFSNENERETVLGSPSMTPRNVTPLVPLTSLRWKSNPSEQESSEQEKAVTVERSRLGLNVTSARSESKEVHSRDDLPTQDGQGEPKEERDGRDRKSFEGFYPIGQTTAEEDEEEDDDDCSALETPDSHDMKSPPGEDVMTMTIDFLRARLLSERSASKAAKARIQELGKKVVELELKLEQVIKDKKKAEKSAEEALLKLLTGDFAQVADCTARAARSIAAISPSEGLHVTSGSGSGREEIKEELRRAESSVGEFSRTDSIASSLESKDSGDSRRKISQGRSEDRNDANGHGDLWVTPKNMFGTDGESPKEQDKRAAIENRLRKMWSQISADMSALAGGGSEEALVQEQLMIWMDQVPLVLQDRLPQKTADDMQFNFATKKNGEKQESYYSQDSQYLSPPAGIQDKAHVRNKSEAEIMLEEYEAHKRVQREWERNYYESKQRLEQSKDTTTQREYASMDYKSGSKDSADDLATPHLGVHQSKSSIDFSHPHNDNPDHRQRLPYPALLEHPHRQAERPEAVPGAHEPRERRQWNEQQLQQEYQENYFQQSGSQGVRRQIGYPPSHPERDSQHRSYALASRNRSAEDAFRDPQGNTGGAHPMWDVRDDLGGLGQTQLDSDYRQRVQRDSDPYRTYHESEKKYGHGHRRSHSADSSNWPTEEDTKVLDHVPHQQRLSGEMNLPHPVYPGKPTQNSLDNRDRRQSYEEDLRLRHETTHGKTGHRQDKYLDVKANGLRLPQANLTGPAKATEPPLYLGYGPAYDAPRDNAPSQPLQQERVSNKSVTDVLLALQKAKASIQKSSSDRVPFTGFSVQTRASSKPVKFEYGLDPQIQYDHILSLEHDLGATTRIRPSNSAPLNYNPSAMDLRPAANGHHSYVDQLNIGKGIDYFF